MENPLAEKIVQLEKEIEKLVDTKDAEDELREVLVAIKDFCDACPLRLQRCTLCYLNDFRLRAERELLT
jgi:hypothetical protein